MAGAKDIISLIQSKQDIEEFQELNWKGTFEEYLGIVMGDSRVCRTAFQRIYDMILSYGVEEYTEYKKKVVKYKFFEDIEWGGVDAVYGLDLSLMRLVNIFKSAAQRYGTERRILLLHGPVGSAKSTIVRLLKKGLETYSGTRDGRVYTFGWLDEKSGTERFIDCPMHEEPLHLVPEELRPDIEAKLNEGNKDQLHQIHVEGELCPSCRYQFSELLSRYNGDWTKVIDHVQVRRLILSEKDRIGIGTFQPKDEKNQDSTELTGDINYRKIAEFGSDSDPRAFNFDGEFNIANRGLIEFIEVLKLDVAFLYDLLGASQEHKIKPKKFSQTDIDEVIIGHTNEPEYRKLQNNEFMEALRDRTVKIDIPYNTR
ncbi:MAG: serine protein kinase, partial [bacterium]